MNICIHITGINVYIAYIKYVLWSTIRSALIQMFGNFVENFLDGRVPNVSVQPRVQGNENVWLRRLFSGHGNLVIVDFSGRRLFLLSDWGGDANSWHLRKKSMKTTPHVVQSFSE